MEESGGAEGGEAEAQNGGKAGEPKLPKTTKRQRNGEKALRKLSF